MYFPQKKKKVTTTCDPALLKQAKDAKLPLAHALEAGLRRLLHQDVQLDEGEKILYEDPKLKLQRCMGSMQERINELNEEIEKIKNGN